jgi:hypothetical protein
MSNDWTIETPKTVTIFGKNTAVRVGSALHQLHAERKQAQLQVEKLDQAISVIESLNGTGSLHQANQPTRIISQASPSQVPSVAMSREALPHLAFAPAPSCAGPTPLAPVKRSMSAAACRKIVANRKDARELFAFAGLWDRWRDPSGKWIKSCSILTTTPNAVTSTVHDRMPVILDPDNYDLWLDPGMTDMEAVMSLV